MNKSYIPVGYKPTLDAYDTQRAIAYIKHTFQDEFSGALNLKRVSAPLFVTRDSGLNDDLNGVERPVSFDLLETVDGMNQVLSRLMWLSQWLTRHEAHHEICWLNPLSNRMETAIIRENEDLTTFLRQILSSPLPKQKMLLADTHWQSTCWHYHVQAEEVQS